MAYVAVNKDGSEVIYDFLPIREPNFNEFWMAQYKVFKDGWTIDPQEVGLPKGSIEKLIGKKLTWEDEPVELKEQIGFAKGGYVEYSHVYAGDIKC